MTGRPRTSGLSELRATARRACLGALLLLFLSALGCSTYSTKSGKVRGELAAGRPEKALAGLTELGDEKELPQLMEMGLLLYLTGDFAGAQESFTRAQTIVDDLYTKSLTREAARLILNDAAQSYRGEIFERVWIHFYRALAFLAAEDFHSAAVEGRAVTFDLRRFSDAEASEGKYRNDPFLQWFAGMLYEADGELNDAWINYQDAERLYREGDIYGVRVPGALIGDLLSAGTRLGFYDQLAPYVARYPRRVATNPLPGEGELVLLISTGMIPTKQSNRIDFPIFKEVEKDKSAQRDGQHAVRVSERAYDDWRSPPRERKLDYVLSIDLPSIPDSPAPPSLSWQAAGREGPLETAADLGALHRACLADRYGGIVVRTVARGLLKYWTKQKIEEEKGEVAGLLFNVFGSVTEVADTRSWVTLPAHVHAARISLPAGEQMVSVGSGKQRRTATVNIEPGRIAFLALRLY